VDIKNLQKEVAAWADYNFPEECVEDCMLGLTEEVGELARCVLKNRQGIRGSTEDHKRAAAEEVGDILIFLMQFCTKSDLDIEKCLTDKWAKVRLRDWQLYPDTGKPPQIDTSICPSCGTEFRTGEGTLLVVRGMEFCSGPCLEIWQHFNHDEEYNKEI